MRMAQALLLFLFIAGMTSPAEARKNEIFFGAKKGERIPTVEERREALMQQQTEVIADVVQKQDATNSLIEALRNDMREYHQVNVKILQILVAMMNDDAVEKQDKADSGQEEREEVSMLLAQIVREQREQAIILRQILRNNGEPSEQLQDESVKISIP